MYMRDQDGHVFETDHPEYHKAAEKLSKTEGKRLLCEQFKAEYKKYFKPNRQIYCIIRKVSTSGMTRHMDFFVHEKDGLRCVTYGMSVILGWRYYKGNLVVNGCGMDMVFHTVDSICRTLGLKNLPHYNIL